MVGYQKEEIIGKYQHSLIHHTHSDGMPYKPEDCPIYHAVNSGKTTYVREDVFWRKDGSSFPVEYISTPIKEVGQIIGSVITFRDISEKKKMEELMIKSEKLSIIGELSAGIAHEIGNPLTTLKGFLQLFEAGTLPKQEYLSIMKTELERIEQISQEMLSLAKPDIANYEYTDIRQLINGVVKLLDTKAFRKSIHIEVDIQNEILIFCVKNQLIQVLINLIKNAIEEMERGTVLISARKIGNEVYIKVKDDGPGIPEHLLKKIGEPFFTTKENGTGLGLLVTYRIIQNHKGKVEVNSKVGVGTTFIITLPVEQ
jgi:PAS domain S-box-containing protein